MTSVLPCNKGASNEFCFSVKGTSESVVRVVPCNEGSNIYDVLCSSLRASVGDKVLVIHQG